MQHASTALNCYQALHITANTVHAYLVMGAMHTKHGSIAGMLGAVLLFSAERGVHSTCKGKPYSSKRGLRPGLTLHPGLWALLNWVLVDTCKNMLCRSKEVAYAGRCICNPRSLTGSCKGKCAAARRGSRGATTARQGPP